MANEGLAGDLDSLLKMAEEILDGVRSAFTPNELERLCFDLHRAIDYLRSPGDGFTDVTPMVPGGPPT
jgi:hypothetical protein